MASRLITPAAVGVGSLHDRYSLQDLLVYQLETLLASAYIVGSVMKDYDMTGGTGNT